MDGTVEVARAAGAEVYSRPWHGFVAARLYALSLVETPWAMMLDADERLDEPLRRAIAAEEPDDGTVGYRLRRVTSFCGKPVRGAGWTTDSAAASRSNDRRPGVSSVVSPHPWGMPDLLAF